MCSTAVRLFGIVLVVLATPSIVRAQAEPTLVFTPAQPTAGTAVTARITASMTWCALDPVVTRSPSEVLIDLRLPNCGGQITPPPPSWQTVEVSMGPLPAGRTRVDVVFSQDFPQPSLSGEVIVAAATVPVRSRWLVAALALGLLLFAAGRYTSGPSRNVR